MAQLEQALRLSLQQQGAHCQAIQAAAEQVCWLVLACAIRDQWHMFLVEIEPGATPLYLGWIAPSSWPS